MLKGVVGVYEVKAFVGEVQLRRVHPHEPRARTRGASVESVISGVDCRRALSLKAEAAADHTIPTPEFKKGVRQPCSWQTKYSRGSLHTPDFHGPFIPAVFGWRGVLVLE